MFVSVIICTKNRLEDFRKTISSLVMQSRLPDELIVVDSSDSPIIQNFLESTDIPIKHHYFRAETGLTRARNVGIDNSNGDLLFFFDDDVDLDINYIKYIEETFASDNLSQIGAMGGRIVNLNLYPVGAVTPFLFLKRRTFDLLRTIFLLPKLGNGNFRFSGFPTQPHALTMDKYIECLSGGCMAFRRDVFKKVRFDENLIGYGHVEDADISKQVLSAGYKIFYVASAKLDHKPSHEDRPSSRKRAELTVINYDYFFRKHWRQTFLRRLAFWWALVGLCFMFIPGAAWQGVVDGAKKLRI